MRISRDGRGETRLTDTQKNRILELAQVVPRDQLLLGLQLERGWRIGSVVGCHNKVTYTRKRTGREGCMRRGPSRKSGKRMWAGRR